MSILGCHIVYQQVTAVEQTSPKLKTTAVYSAEGSVDHPGRPQIWPASADPDWAHPSV